MGRGPAGGHYAPTQVPECEGIWLSSSNRSALRRYKHTAIWASTQTLRVGAVPHGPSPSPFASTHNPGRF